ncbi:MAG TPA: DUF92 domain-containing protein [Gemmatimonadaceae bacterium]|nr:DUF92 domain-containing protein [Gemmatimonadaceae bacterium]
MPNVTRLLSGLAVAALIAGAARRTRALSPSGAVAAVVVGTAAVAAGWDWGALLVAFFLASTLLSRVRRSQKASAAAAIVAKGDERDAVQVLANGALFALAAVAAIAAPGGPWRAAGAGALAAATSDTWSTEIGMLSLRAPRSIVTWRPMPPGTSGGVTLLGLFGAVLGAAFIEMVTLGVHWSGQTAAAALAGGIAGSLADSVLGATVQQRRWCDRCRQATERAEHACGAPTRLAGGLAWLDNDGVNVACTLVGAAVACAIAWRP